MRLRDYKRGMATQDVPVVLQESDIQSSITPTTRLTGARGSCQNPQRHNTVSATADDLRPRFAQAQLHSLRISINRENLFSEP
jgi:hypothetical protein